MLTLGNVPAGVSLRGEFRVVTRIQPDQPLFSLLQATVQASQPMHRSWSMTKPKRFFNVYPPKTDGAY